MSSSGSEQDGGQTSIGCGLVLATVVVAVIVAVPAAGAAPQAHLAGGSAAVDGASTAGGPAPQSDDPGQAESDAVREIDSCTEINESGRYVLAQDIENSSESTCIEIRADDVVLDGGGHVIDGPRTAEDYGAFVAEMFENGSLPWEPRWSNHGVAVNGTEDRPISNVTVENLETTDWYFGVYYQRVEDATVRNVTARNNADGISLYNVTDAAVENNSAVENAGGGVLLGFAENATVAGTNATGNIDGINLYRVSDSEISENELTANEDGLFAVALDNTTVERNAVHGNSWAGLFLSRSTGIHFSNNTITNTTGELTVFSDSSAIVLYNTTENSFEGTTLRNNANWSFYSLRGAENNTGERVDVGPARISFTATNAAFALAEEQPGDAFGGGDPIVSTNTENESSLDLSVEWRRANATVADATVSDDGNATVVEDNATVSRTPNETAEPDLGFGNKTNETASRIG